MICEKCGNVNPQSAKFCKECGTSIECKNQFLLKEITHVRLNSIWWYFILFGRLIALVLFFSIFIIHVDELNYYTKMKSTLENLTIKSIKISKNFDKGFIADYSGSNYYFSSQEGDTPQNAFINFIEYNNCDQDISRSTIFILINLPTALLFLIIILYSVTTRKKKNKELLGIASGIEDTPKRRRIITKAGMLGLYDWEKRKVLLPVEYQSLEQMDNNNFLKLYKGDKQGLYSYSLNKVIFACEYDSISQFTGGIATLINGKEIFKTDMQGNIFK